MTYGLTPMRAAEVVEGVVVLLEQGQDGMALLALRRLAQELRATAEADHLGGIADQIATRIAAAVLAGGKPGDDA